MNYSSFLIKHQNKFTVILATMMIFFLVQSCEYPTDAEGAMSTETVVEKIAFSPEIPVDVDPALQTKLKNEGNIYALNEAFNDFSWKAFVAINWPRNKEGDPTPKFTDEGTATWLGWKEAFQVYREDGKKPAPWGSPRTASGLGLQADALQNTDARIALSNRTPTQPTNIANEVDQAFAGKLYDQNGNVVVYEVLMNKAEFDYIVQNNLFNINGQIAFAKNTPNANFPIGDYSNGEVGAVEIKFAWKILESSDIKERYYVDEGYIINPDTEKLELKTLGMIGMHISQKTPTGKQWVWSTFEHIDNLEQNVAYIDGKRKIIQPSLTDPDCEICPVNLDLSSGDAKFNTNKHGDYWKLSNDSHFWFANSENYKTQAKRMVDIPVRVENINQKMQDYFKSVGSVWQYYRLIDTQYPLDQDVPPTSHEEDSYVIPGSVNNKPGGNSNLALLTNITMETFFQAGNQNAANLMEANPKTNFQVFGTESCMGCHSSAGIYNGVKVSQGKITPTSGDQLSGDFSWLLGTASWFDKIPVDPGK